MSKTLYKPNYYNEGNDAYPPVALMPADENLTAKLAGEITEKNSEVVIANPVNHLVIEKPVLTTQAIMLPKTIMASMTNKVEAFSNFLKIVMTGVSLFLIGAIAIFIYFSSHPVLYKTNSLKTFELRRILANEPQVTAPTTTPTTGLSTSTRIVSSPEIKVENKIIDDYILSIQPNTTPLKMEVQAALKEDLKKDISQALPIMSLHPDVSALEAQPKNIASDEKALLEKNLVEKTKGDNTKSVKNNNILLKPVDGISQHGIKEPVCSDAVRALNQCH